MTPRTRDLLAALETLGQGGAAPSYQELARALGLVSRGCVHRLVRQAEREGFVERLPGRARTLKLVQPTPAALGTQSEAALQALHTRIGAELERRTTLLSGTNREQLP